MRSLASKVLIAFSLSLWLGWPSFAQTLQIDRLKANYLIAFVDFARWEGELKIDVATIGILGSKDLARELRKITHSKTEGRKIKILKLESGETERLSQVDILFVGSGYEKQWHLIKARCKEHAMLLVGEQRGFLEEEGGAIQFAFRKNRLRFSIAPENARSQGVELSSTLIELAIE